MFVDKAGHKDISQFHDKMRNKTFSLQSILSDEI